MRANSVMVRGFFMPTLYHAAGMEAADIHIAARAFSIIVASWASPKGNSTTRDKRGRID
jgi:hypothetical protein